MEQHYSQCYHFPNPLSGLATVKSGIRILVCLIFIFISYSCFTSCMKMEYSEYQLELHNGLENQTIIDICIDDINDVRKKNCADSLLSIDYAMYDLDEDGLADFIVSISSPLHTGSQGDTVYIFKNDGDGHFNRIGCFSIQI